MSNSALEQALGLTEGAMKVRIVSLRTCTYIWLTAAVLLGPAGTAPSSAKPYEVRCKEPLPVFTLGETSNPTKTQEATLCTCIWENLGSWERRASEKITIGKESEVSQLHLRAFPARFGSTVKKCGGMKLSSEAQPSDSADR